MMMNAPVDPAHQRRCCRQHETVEFILDNRVFAICDHRLHNVE